MSHESRSEPAEETMDESWIEKYGEVVSFGGVLEASGAFETTRDVIYYFGKPWKWHPEYVRWVSAGRPETLDLEEPTPADTDWLEEAVARQQPSVFRSFMLRGTETEKRELADAKARMSDE